MLIRKLWFIPIFLIVLQVSAEDSFKIYGSIETRIEGKWGQNSSDVRQDWDAFADLDFYSTKSSNDFSFALSGRVSGDIDGRRPSLEPGIYNGIYETFDNAVQPWLYRAWIDKGFKNDDGAGIKSLRIGRQYHTGGDFLWFDGIEMHTLVPIQDRRLDIVVFGGVPVRLYESARNDWLIGSGTSLQLEKVRLGLEGYYIEEDVRFNRTRKNAVGRASIDAVLSESLNFSGVIRGINDDEFDGRARLTINNLPKNSILRLDYRFQTEDRGPHTTELDAQSIILARTVGATRRAFNEYGADIMIPFADNIVLDIGAMTRDFSDSEDRYNLDFDRFYLGVSISDIKFANKLFDVSITGEAYETRSDYTKAISGDVSTELCKNVTASAGTSFALYSYDYATDQVKDNVRYGTAKLVWTPSKPFRFNIRYDLEDDDYRLHHYLSAGCRYVF